MGLLTKPYEYVFCKAIKRIQNGKAVPKFMMDAVKILDTIYCCQIGGQDS